MIDINKPITNPTLVKAMQAMNQNKNQETTSNMIDEVMAAHFVSPVIIEEISQKPDSEGKIVLEKDTHINFNIIENENNEKFYLVFTDWEELGRWKQNENQQTLIMTFDDYAAMFQNIDGCISSTNDKRK